MAEQRSQPRRRVLKGAIVAYNLRHSTLPGSVTNLSSEGCCIRAPGSVNVPDTFELIIELDGLEASCEVIWRNVDIVGVRFIEPPRRVAAKRIQVVRPSHLPKKPSLRRERSMRRQNLS